MQPVTASSVSIGDREIGPGRPSTSSARSASTTTATSSIAMQADRRRRRGRLRRRQVPEAHPRRRLHPGPVATAARHPLGRDQRRPQARARVRRGRVPPRSTSYCRDARHRLVRVPVGRGAPSTSSSSSTPPRHKVASASPHRRRAAPRTCAPPARPIILSTGMSTLEADPPRGRGPRHGQPPPAAHASTYPAQPRSSTCA